MANTSIPNVTLTEASKMLCVSRKSVMRWVKSGRLKAVWVGSRLRTTEEWIGEVVKPVEVESERQEPAKPRRKESRTEKETSAERAARGLAAFEMLCRF